MATEEASPSEKRVSIEYLCYWLKRFVLLYYDERPVIDKTGLTGYYDFTLSYIAESCRRVSINRIFRRRCWRGCRFS